MRCPKCGATENLVYFLRHQKMNEKDEDKNINCWTILCKECGHNESYLLEDLLDEIFINWSEVKQNTIFNNENEKDEEKILIFEGETKNEEVVTNVESQADSESNSNDS